MTVKQLIKELQKLPQNLEVITSAHDNSPLEYQYSINKTHLIDFDKERSKNPDPLSDFGLKGSYVTLTD